MPGLMCIAPQQTCYAEKRPCSDFLSSDITLYRHYAFERATLEHGKQTQLLMLTNKQIADFKNIIRPASACIPPGDLPDRKI